MGCLITGRAGPKYLKGTQLHAAECGYARRCVFIYIRPEICTTRAHCNSRSRRPVNPIPLWHCTALI